MAIENGVAPLLINFYENTEMNKLKRSQIWKPGN